MSCSETLKMILFDVNRAKNSGMQPTLMDTKAVVPL